MNGKARLAHLLVFCLLSPLSVLLLVVGTVCLRVGEARAHSMTEGREKKESRKFLKEARRKLRGTFEFGVETELMNSNHDHGYEWDVDGEGLLWFGFVGELLLPSSEE